MSKSDERTKTRNRLSSLITHHSLLITLPPHRHSHDCFFVAVRPLKHTGQSSFVHHGHSLTDAQNFFHVAADHHDRYAAFSQAAHQLIDFCFGADVDSASGLVKDQH